MKQESIATVDCMLGERGFPIPNMKYGGYHDPSCHSSRFPSHTP